MVLPSHFPRLESERESEDLRPKLASADVDARVVGISAFLENPARALQSAAPSKAPSRRSARLSMIGRAMGSNLPSRECSPSLAALAESLALAAGLLKRAAAAPWKVQPLQSGRLLGLLQHPAKRAAPPLCRAGHLQ